MAASGVIDDHHDRVPAPMKCSAMEDGGMGRHRIAAPGRVLARWRRRTMVRFSAPPSRRLGITRATAEAPLADGRNRSTGRRCPLWFRIGSTSIGSCRLWRSARDQYRRWPLPMGMAASTPLIPVCRGTCTGALCMMGGAVLLDGQARPASIAIATIPAAGQGRRPLARSRPSPTGTSTTRSLRRTRVAGAQRVV